MKAIGAGLMPVVKLNRRRESRGAQGQRVFGLRSAVERLNSFLKEGIGIGRFPSYVRGLRRVVLFVPEKMLLALAAMLANLKTQKPLLSYA